MAFFKRKKDSESLVRRAHLGDIENPSDIINLAKVNGIKTAPLDLEAIFRLLNIRLLYSDQLENDVSGHLEKMDDSWVCTINGNHHKSRQRFTMAHELAHYVLHRNEQSDFVDTTFFRSVDRNPMEYEANEFAGSILMPKDDFLFLYRKYEGNIEVLAVKFGVSPTAVRVRSVQLELI